MTDASGQATAPAALDGGAQTGGAQTGGAAPTGLPCDVASFLKLRCGSCHGAPPLPGIPMALVSYADLIAPAHSNPALSNAQLGLQRMQAGSMPPGGGLSAPEIQQFGAWVQAGAQAGSCAAGGLADAGPAAPGAADAAPPDASAGDALDAGAGPTGAPDAETGEGSVLDASAADAGPSDGSSPCSSGQSWTGGSRSSALMSPGSACVACHATSAGPLSFGGTVYPAAHEPDDCNGVLGNGVSVLIKGADGRKLTLAANSVGNFFSQTSIALPYTVEIHYQGRVRSKLQALSDGDCNSCHSERGANGAAGRLVLP